MGKLYQNLYLKKVEMRMHPKGVREEIWRGLETRERFGNYSLSLFYIYFFKYIWERELLPFFHFPFPIGKHTFSGFIINEKNIYSFISELS